VRPPAESKRTNRRAKRPPAAARAVATAPLAGTGSASDVSAPAAADGTLAASGRSACPALPPALDIRDIRETFEFLRSAVNCGVERIDASGVVRVDTAGLQLLLAAGRTAAAHGRALRWAGASSTLIEAATRLGVAGLLGIATPD
jgi:ABC-type transporter Mla MlaB component